jgi:GNAT superfamily N-acetyltransferase
MGCQIIHDSIHRRPGWTRSWMVRIGDRDVGVGSIAEAGPWRDRPTLFEFYLVPEVRPAAASLFAMLASESGARFVETQTNDLVLGPLLPMVSPEAACEKLILADCRATDLPSGGATLQRITSREEELARFKDRDGSSEWQLVLDGTVIGRGGIAFHYNPPYGDAYMGIDEPHRGRGFGSYFLQELKRICRGLGGTPAARCSPDNLASLRCCEKAGLTRCAQLMSGPIAAAVPSWAG